MTSSPSVAIICPVSELNNVLSEGLLRPKGFIVFLLLSAVSAAAAGEFVSYESGICIFKLQGFELTTPVERAIVFGVERIVDTYRETFGFPFPEDFKVTVTIFTDKDKFLDYQKKQCGKIISEYGYYSSKYRETGTFHEKNTKKTKDAKDMVATVFHEANHLILRHHIPWCPNWVNEGLSEYFGELNVFGENRRVYLHTGYNKWFKYWAKNGFPIELEKYLNLSYDRWMSFRKTDSTAAYGIGYSLVYFMMSRSSTEKVLKELLWEFKRRGKDANSIEVVNKCYPGGFEKFKRNWLRWIPRARPYRPLRALRTQAEKAKKQLPAESQARRREDKNKTDSSQSSKRH